MINVKSKKYQENNCNNDAYLYGYKKSQYCNIYKKEDMINLYRSGLAWQIFSYEYNILFFIDILNNKK